MSSTSASDPGVKRSTRSRGGEGGSVRVAILIENSASVYHSDIERGLSEINETLRHSEGVTVHSAIDISYGVDPYKSWYPFR